MVVLDPTALVNGKGKERVFRPASPRAKRAARESGIDLALVSGTGPGGRILEADVLRFAEGKRRAGTPETARVRRTPAEIKSIPAAGQFLEPGMTGRLVPLGRKRRVTAEKMALSARTVARITLALEVDMAEAVRLREELLPVYEAEYGLRPSYSDLLVLVVSRALREHPHLNARWTEEGIVLIDQVNVGLAVAVEDGLVVPVVREADTKKLAQIATIVDGLTSKARDGRLSLEEISGGTFTITNLGMYGIEFFTPIVNPPEAAILGVGKIVEKPVVRDGQVVPRPTMALALSVDHRVVDGAPAAQFLARVQQLLEGPFLLL